MFFLLSKTLGLFMAPSNLMAALGLIGIALLFTRFRRLASWLIVTSLVAHHCRLKPVHRENSQTKSYQDNAFAVRPET